MKLTWAFPPLKKKMSLKVQCAGFRRLYWDPFDIIFIFTWPSVYKNLLKVRIVVLLSFVVAVGSHTCSG